MNIKEIRYHSMGISFSVINVRILFEKILYPFGMRLALLAFNFCHEKNSKIF